MVMNIFGNKTGFSFLNVPFFLERCPQNGIIGTKGVNVFWNLSKGATFSTEEFHDQC